MYCDIAELASIRRHDPRRTRRNNSGLNKKKKKKTKTNNIDYNIIIIHKLFAVEDR